MEDRLLRTSPLMLRRSRGRSPAPAASVAVRPQLPDSFEQLLGAHRRELLVHCYRMLGSWTDAEDVFQEVSLRAWRGLARFEARASVRAWLYKIATNTCLTALRGRSRRTLPDPVRGRCRRCTLDR